MSRRERENMIMFIKKVKGIEQQELLFMTDEDIEYIYDRTYFHHETNE